MLSETLKRPTDFSQLIGNTELINTLKEIKNIPNLLFYGPAGVGKTTIIKIMVKDFDTRNILELNASDDRGINIVREIIKPFCMTASFPNTHHLNVNKVIILDEVDSMSKDAQNALRRILEDYRNVKFCLICNYVNKLIPAILSRCSKFRFSLISIDEMKPRVIELLNDQKLEFEEESIERICKEAGGDMRKCLNDLNGIYFTYKVLCVSSTNLYYGLDFNQMIYENIVDLIKSKKIENAFKLLYLNGNYLYSLRNMLNVIEDEKVVSYASILEDKMNSGQNEEVLIIGLFSKIVSVYQNSV
ncbi:Replication factor C subunit 3 [Cucumispora dikerogammari]|nr:Replication factor C subunit 3 [Cucumispora dikerogammari]